MSAAARLAAIDAGKQLIVAVQDHLALITADQQPADRAEELEHRLWDAVAAYGDALDILNGAADQSADDEPGELRFTVRTRYDYTVVDEKAFLSGGLGVGSAVLALLEGVKPLSALEVASLETGSGLLTVHLNNEPLVAEDFRSADEPTDLLLVAPGEILTGTRDEPVFGSHAEAEAAARQISEG